MKYFVSWTNNEPEFQYFDTNCNILISPANVPLSWNISFWKSQPKSLFIDSGIFSVRNNKFLDCLEIFKRQLSISNGWEFDNNLFFSHPDILIPLNCNYKETNERINLSIQRAKEYFGHLSRKKNKKIIPVGVIHGFNEETILNSYYELFDIGYRYFALGSLGIRFAHNKKKCLNAISIAQKYRIRPLHIFGATLPLNSIENFYGIDSFDSSTPTKLAFYGTVLYGSPLKRYVIRPDSKQKLHIQSFSFREKIDFPLECKCPICRKDPNQLTNKYGKIGKEARIIHNYFQIKWETEKI